MKKIKKKIAAKKYFTLTFDKKNLGKIKAWIIPTILTLSLGFNIFLIINNRSIPEEITTTSVISEENNSQEKINPTQILYEEKKKRRIIINLSFTSSVTRL